MSDDTSSSKSRRSVLKIAGISLAGIVGGTGLGAAQTEQRQRGENVNLQDGFAGASGRNSQANVNQRSEQNIGQNQQAGNGHDKTRQSQEARNENAQVGTASASGRNSEANVNQRSEQNIDQNQES